MSSGHGGHDAHGGGDGVPGWVKVPAGILLFVFVIFYLIPATIASVTTSMIRGNLGLPPIGYVAPAAPQQRYVPPQQPVATNAGQGGVAVESATASAACKYHLPAGSNGTLYVGGRKC